MHFSELNFANGILQTPCLTCLLELPEFMASRAPKPPDSLETLNTFLNIIRTNLSNIERTWGSSSSQLTAAREIYERALKENVKRMGIGVETEGVGMDELIRGIQGMGLSGEGR